MKLRWSRQTTPQRPVNTVPNRRNTRRQPRTFGETHGSGDASLSASPANWSTTSWKSKLAAHQVVYEDRAAVERAVAKLATLPPLVTSWEIERLKEFLAEAQRGERFLLQGGDCAETLDDCRPSVITNKLKILLQMSLVLVHGAKLPIVRVGRLAGQYAKPRSSPTESFLDDEGREVTLPSYFGDLINRVERTTEARRTDPHLMVRGYQHAAMTLNFIRALTEGGFADLHHPEYWDLSFVHHDDLAPALREEYLAASRGLAEALEFMEAMGETRVEDLTRAEFFTSHEGLNLLYESAQTRSVPRREGFYNLTTHLPWIGERTRGVDGAHVEYFRGIVNPVGVKVGPTITGDELIRLVDALNPGDEPGKLLLIARMGAGNVASALPPLVERVRREGRAVLWVCDPMHGNGMKAADGTKTRSFDAILAEIEASFDIHEAQGTWLGGIHFELTGEDVTECVGGGSGVTEADLSRNYATLCDPRLNYQQSLEMAFRVAKRMGAITSARKKG
ncbi:MAG: 3-deoxy-7-phosphoheptulonate synthase [Phycisphaeraceae bacterium]|nr:3-deoxy-7-phosphoheptulonate synthase [Phycisphaeraceae bacterium]